MTSNLTCLMFRSPKHETYVCMFMKNEFSKVSRVLNKFHKMGHFQLFDDPTSAQQYQLLHVSKF